MELATILMQGRSYLAQEEATRTATVCPEFRQELGRNILRRHSTAMRGVDRHEAEALLAAVIGAVKWAERHDACGRHLGDCLLHLEDAAASLRLANMEDEQA
jgi:hypothetical protein